MNFLALPVRPMSVSVAPSPPASPPGEDGLPVCTVVADDFGISEQRNLGIVDAMLHGVVTHTSIMANGAAATSAVALARQHGLSHRINLHLNLTEGRPLLGEQVPSLLDDSGQRLRGKVGFRKACNDGMILPAEAAAEARAQCQWFARHLGRHPSRVDGHQHCHVHPKLTAALASALAVVGVQSVRIPNEKCLSGALCPLCSRIGVEAAVAIKVYAAAGIRASTSSFVGLSLCGGAYSVEQLTDAIRAQLSDGARTCEVMVHPGRPQLVSAWDAFDASEAREQELSSLCEPKMRAALEKIVHLSFPPLQAKPTYHESVVASRDDVSVCVGDLKLELHSPTGVHMDVLNAPLLSAISQAVRRDERVMYHGCGTGLMGLLALRHGASFVHFADVSEDAMRSTAINAAAEGYEQGQQWNASLADLNDNPAEAAAQLLLGGAFDVVLCNPPQMPGPPALQKARPDKFGGADGMHYYRRLVEHTYALLRSGGRVAFMQTSFSSFAAVDRLFAERGAHVRTLASQPRTSSLDAIEALAPGCAEWLQRLHDRGGAHFNQEGQTLIYKQRFAVADFVREADKCHVR